MTFQRAICKRIDKLWLRQAKSRAEKLAKRQCSDVFIIDSIIDKNSISQSKKQFLVIRMAFWYF